MCAAVVARHRYVCCIQSQYVGVCFGSMLEQKCGTVRDISNHIEFGSYNLRLSIFEIVLALSVTDKKPDQKTDIHVKVEYRQNSAGPRIASTSMTPDIETY